MVIDLRRLRIKRAPENAVAADDRDNIDF